MGAQHRIFLKHDIFDGPNISFDAALSDFMVQKIFLNSLSSTLCKSHRSQRATVINPGKQ